MFDGEYPGDAERATSSTLRRTAAVAGVAVAVVAMLTGCFPVAQSAATHVRRSHAPRSTPAASGAASVESDSPSPAPTPPDATASHAATPEPVSMPLPSPTLTSIPQGTVVAEGDVASPKGSIHFHYRMVADGDNTYSAQYSGFTSTLPVPVSVTLIDIPPKVGDGLTYHGVGDHQLGGPTTTSAPASSASLGDVGQPSYLGTLVTYSGAAATDAVPIEIGPNKVLAVNTVHWSIPARQSNVHPIDGGARSYAEGTVTATTASGAPKRYLVAPGDITSVVAHRFSISIADLIWLNANLQVFGDKQYLYESTTLNLDPDSL